MSFQDMAWAVNQKCESAGQKLVLLMLANHANGHTGQCNPSHKRLADECNMGISTLKRNISGLEDSGFLSVLHKAQDGVSLPNQYRLKSFNLEWVGPNRAGGGSNLDGRVGPNRATKQEVEPITKPIDAKEAKASSSAKLIACPHDELIDLFAANLPQLAQPRKSLWKSGKNAPALKARWDWVMTSNHETGRRAGERMAITKEDGLDWFDKFFKYVAKSSFLTGKSGEWACDLIWLVNASKFEKVLQGSYENKQEAA